MAFARFDDVKPGRSRSFALTSCLATLSTFERAEVPEVLAEVEREVDRGRWAAGWVSYEASPGLNPALTVRDGSGSPLGDLPLVWFGIFERRQQAEDLRSGGYALGEWTPSIDAARHGFDVVRIRELIREGEVYQVNHTFRLGADFEGVPSSFYRDLVRSQNGGYCAHLDAGRWQVLSASPELFFEWRNGLLVSRPMKGTVRRGRDSSEDLQMRDALVTSAKDQAENVMIVDMVRNDLGRVALPGTVEVPALFAIEKYDTVWQMTSTVTAEPREGVSLVDVFEALFPAASITGAPKVAAMNVISRLEDSPRGVYTGAIGFGGPDGEAGSRWRFNVGIRTVLVDQATSRGWYGTGGGVTFDSTPAGEYSEALLKTEVLARRSSDFALIETMRWTPDEGFHSLDRHVERLLESADYFDIPASVAEVRQALDQAVLDSAVPVRVRLRLSREGRVTVETAPMPADKGPIRVAVDDVAVNSLDPFLRHKTSRREVFEEAAARHHEAEDVILVNERGELTETTIANLVVRIDGQWHTPHLASGCLPGVERARLLSAGTVTERVLTRDDLDRSTGLARVNSLRGWEPITLGLRGDEGSGGEAAGYRREQERSLQHRGS